MYTKISAISNRGAVEMDEVIFIILSPSSNWLGPVPFTHKMPDHSRQAMLFEDIRYFRYKLVKKESRKVGHTVAKKLRVGVVHPCNG